MPSVGHIYIRIPHTHTYTERDHSADSAQAAAAGLGHHGLQAAQSNRYALYIRMYNVSDKRIGRIYQGLAADSPFVLVVGNCGQNERELAPL